MHDTSDNSSRGATAACLALSVATLFIAACEQRDTRGAGQEPPSQSTGEKKAAAAPGEKMPRAPDPKSGNVQCLGIHECKGKSACHVIGSHACAGQNECKGKGWVSVPTEECQAKGGKVIDS